MGSLPPKGGYDRGRGARVIARARVFLDHAFPITGTSHADVRRYHVQDGQLLIDDLPLDQPEKFVGYKGDPRAPQEVVLKNNGLHVVLVFDRAHPIGSRDQALLADVQIESAISAIMDCEDSVACVDAEDKVTAYRNWLGLMLGTLEATFTRDGTGHTRKLRLDRAFHAPGGTPFTLKGRSFLWVRNVGHLMQNPAIKTADGDDIFEGLMDAVITTLIGMHDLRRESGNSVKGSIYVVKPKMHGPEEVAFCDEIFSRVENLLGLPQYTVKIGLMDEERRTSVNLKECIRAAKHRIAFINTGFLDRTGDEIHTSMEAGPFSRKDFIKRKSWILGYENQNVDIGLECGLFGKAQIGKVCGQCLTKWPQCWNKKLSTQSWCDLRLGSLTHGRNNPCASLSYGRCHDSTKKLKAGGRRAYVDTLLDIPLATYQKWTESQIMREVENNAKGSLGMWCDGSITALAVQKCQTSTMWVLWRTAPPAALAPSISQTGCITAS